MHALKVLAIILCAAVLISPGEVGRLVLAVSGRLPAIRNIQAKIPVYRTEWAATIISQGKERENA
jgi:hypothetical protein